MNAIPQSVGLPELENYQLKEVIGTGRTSIVYRAKDSVGDDVAIKVLNSDHAEDQRALLRFYAGARAHMLVDHIRTLDLREVAESNGLHYQVAEYAAGGTLAGASVAGIPIPEPAALRLAILLAESLDLVHAAGFVHRDVMPASVFLTRDGEPLLGRFGLVYNSGGKQDLTDLWGCPSALAYAAPQQLRSAADVHVKDDVYSLGVLLYYCLTGDVPFRSISLPSIIQQKESLTTEMLSALQAFDARTGTLVMRCLAAERKSRPDSTWEVATYAAAILGKKASDYWTGSPRHLRQADHSSQRWLLLLGDGDGGTCLRSASIEQITQRILRGAFDHTVLASPSHRIPFRPLANIEAFLPFFQ